jgi:hypothetical protein
MKAIFSKTNRKQIAPSAATRQGMLLFLLYYNIQPRFARHASQLLSLTQLIQYQFEITAKAYIVNTGTSGTMEDE